MMMIVIEWWWLGTRLEVIGLDLGFFEIEVALRIDFFVVEGRPLVGGFIVRAFEIEIEQILTSM